MYASPVASGTTGVIHDQFIVAMAVLFILVVFGYILQSMGEKNKLLQDQERQNYETLRCRDIEALEQRLARVEMELEPPKKALICNVDTLMGEVKSRSVGLERETTLAIVRSVELLKIYKSITPLTTASVTFYDAVGEKLLEADGLLIGELEGRGDAANILLFNETKIKPNCRDAKALLMRAEILHHQVIEDADASVTASGTFDMASLRRRQVQKVTPILSGYAFADDVLEFCAKRGIICIKTNGAPYDTVLPKFGAVLPGGAAASRVN